jgi:hypothetical protein
MRASSIIAIAAVLAVAALAWVQAPADAKRKRHDSSVIGNLDCSACHTPDSWALSNRAGAKGAFDHDKTGFPLTGEHGKVLCTSCHKPKQQVQRECFSCHKDRHRGRLGRQCDACHNSTKWTQTRAIRRHRMTRLPLTGMHAMLDCTSCHVRRNDRQFLPVPADCFSCHEQEYRSPNIHPVHQGDPNDPSVQPFSRDCSQCHQPSGWSPAYVNPSALQSSLRSPPAGHDRVFVLSRGAHRGARCESCHPSSKLYKLVSCSGCHVHNRATLRRQHGRWVPNNAVGCMRCHPRGLGK